MEEAKRLCMDASKEGKRIDVLMTSTDVTNEDDVNRLMDLVISHFGRVDLLFNNAGINITRTSAESSSISRNALASSFFTVFIMNARPP